jgi:hypothetical protein
MLILNLLLFVFLDLFDLVVVVERRSDHVFIDEAFDLKLQGLLNLA